jgi:hypothetical protein
MQNFLASRKVIWLFVGIGVIAIAAITAAYYGQMQNRASLLSKKTPQPKYEVTRQDVSSSKLPDKFPADFPVEAGANITQNYQATTPDGRQQSTRTFETAKSLDDNLKIYQDYFKKNGWTVNSTQKGDNYRSILASKGDLLIQVAIDENASSHVKTVNITAIPKVPALQPAAGASKK